MVRVIKKDHTREAFNIQKVVTAVNKCRLRFFIGSYNAPCAVCASAGMQRINGGFNGLFFTAGDRV